MKRIPISQVLKDAGIDAYIEYQRLYRWFYYRMIPIDWSSNNSLNECCNNVFLHLDVRGSCTSLDDYNKSLGYNFIYTPSDFNLDYLVSFCQYSYNLVYCLSKCKFRMCPTELSQEIQMYLQQIKRVIEKIGYMENVHDGITEFVPKDQVAVSVAEIVDSDLSYKVIEYNHHSMKGDIERKRATLIALANKLEPLRSRLKQASASMESDLFFLLNSMNVRHNNTAPSGSTFKPFVARMDKEEIEQWYDDIYQMCLLAFLELEHLDRKSRIQQLKKNMEQK